MIHTFPHEHQKRSRFRSLWITWSRSWSSLITLGSIWRAFVEFPVRATSKTVTYKKIQRRSCPILMISHLPKPKQNKGVLLNKNVPSGRYSVMHISFKVRSFPAIGAFYAQWECFDIYFWIIKIILLSWDYWVSHNLNKTLFSILNSILLKRDSFGTKSLNRAKSGAGRT